jgi:hypothetical protein
LRRGRRSIGVEQAYVDSVVVTPTQYPQSQSHGAVSTVQATTLSRTNREYG